MSLPVPERIHIAPLGYEKDRVVLPITDSKADIAYLLEHPEPDEEKPDYHQDVKEEIREAGIEVRAEKCDIFNLYSTLAGVARIVSRHLGDDIYVNLSTGSKISAIGGMIACMVFRGDARITPYYVKPESYASEDVNQPVSSGKEDILSLPTYHIEGPSKAEVETLSYLSENGPMNKKKLIKFARGKLKVFIDNCREKGITEYDDEIHMGEYRLLDTYALDPLLDRGCIEIQEVGREKRISVTQEGEHTVQGFEYLTIN